MTIKVNTHNNIIELYNVAIFTYDNDIHNNIKSGKSAVQGISFFRAEDDMWFYIANVSYDTYLTVLEELYTNGKADLTLLGKVVEYDDERPLFSGLF